MIIALFLIEPLKGVMKSVPWSPQTASTMRRGFSTDSEQQIGLHFRLHLSL